MIWVLLFSLLFNTSNTNQFYVLTDGSKVITSHIKDKERKKELQLSLSKSKKDKKELDIASKNMVKALERLFMSRDATQEEFLSIRLELTTIHSFTKKSNLKLNDELHQQVTAEEWELIKPDLVRDIKKRDAKSERGLKKTNKQFDKFEKALSQVITDSLKAQIAISALHNFQSTFNLRTNQHRVRLLDSFESNNFSAFSNSMLAQLFDNDLQNFDEELESCMTLHAILVKQTTEDEWRKLQKKLKLPF